jgi:hypothetical protein
MDNCFDYIKNQLINKKLPPIHQLANHCRLKGVEKVLHMFGIKYPVLLL